MAESDQPRSTVRLLWLTFALCHLVIAIAAWLLLPGGFPISHPHAWTNRVLPFAVALYAIALASCMRRSCWRTTTLAMLASPLFCIGAAMVGAIAFPISGRIAAIVVITVAVVVMFAMRRNLRRWWPKRAALIGVSAIAAALGAMLPIAERSPLRDTYPFSTTTSLHIMQPLDTVLTTQRISPALRVVPSSGEVMVDVAGRTIQVLPLLTFESRSPDRCWANLAPKTNREGPRRQLCSAAASVFEYLDDGYSRLTVRDEAGVASIDSRSTLPQPIYSHLNTFNEFTIAGHRKLSLIFSPTPQTPIDVTYSEYPTGVPEKIAYLDASGVFHIVQASTGEKGPFTELAHGPLRREEPLSITLLDHGEPFAKVTMLDFASQAGVQLSPTAGWGLPVNSIEFSLYDAADRSVAGIFVTLAATSVGRGWDSVGHAAGTYRNRVTIEPVVAKRNRETLEW